MIRTALLFISLLVLASGNSAFAQVDGAAALRVKLNSALQSQNFTGALEAGKALLAIDPKDTTANFGVGVALHSTGKVDEAIPYHEAAAAGSGQWAPVGAYNAGCAYSLKGNPDKAFEWLNKSLTLGFRDVEQLKMDPDLKSLHADARWTELFATLTAKPAKKGNLRILNQVTPRLLTRVSAFTSSFDACLGEVAIEYGPVAWKADFQKKLDNADFDGTRWRLGNDFWTNLDSNVAFTLGGTKFAPGDYYLVIERNAESKKFLLTLIPTDEIRKSKADAFEAETKAKGGISVEMAHSDRSTVADKLAIVLAAESESSPSGTLTIDFGTHRLTTPFTMAIN